MFKRRRTKLGLLLALCAAPLACAPPPVLRKLAPEAPASGDPVEARFIRAQAYLDESRPGEAIMELRAVEAETADNDPRRLREGELLGRIYLDAHDWDPARDAFVKAIALARRHDTRSPLVADCYVGIGLSLLGQSHYVRAAEYLRKGLELGPNPDARRRAEKALAKAESRVDEDVERQDFGPEFRVMRLVVDARWTEDKIVRERIPFKEGDTISGRELMLARASLYRMNLFKAVDVSTISFEGGAEVSVTVKDGWYFIPVPLVTAGAGDTRGGVIIEQRNLFSQAESMDLLIQRGKSGGRTSVGASWEGWSGRFSVVNRSYSENIYADGAYSSVSSLGTPFDRNNFANFGPIITSYGKTTSDDSLAVEGPIKGPWRGEGGYDRSTVSYDSPGPINPLDSGKQGNIFAAVKYGAPADPGPGLGAILGFGLAGLEERLRPLRRPQWNQSGEFRVIEAGRASRSSFGYGEYQIRSQTSFTWGDYETVSLTVAGGHGASLPDAKLLATGRLSGLQGTYSREYRGPTVAGGSLSYAKRLYASRWGLVQGAVFAEDGRAWFHNVSRDKQGFGASIFFRFWRFPLPLGVSYTYSLDDRNGLVAGAIGGRF